MKIKSIIFLIFLTFNLVTFTDKSPKKSNVGVLIFSDKQLYSSWQYLKPLMEFFQDDNIKAIVLLFEVDYGYFGTSQAFSLAKSIVALKQIYKKPVIAYGENWLARSAYLIAASADYIMSSPLCILGHMGYHTNYTDQTVKNAKEGIVETPIAAGKYKYFMSPDHNILEDDLNKIKNHFNNCWQNIIKELIALRPALDKHKDKWINGEIFTPNQKLNNVSFNVDNFFVDKIGDKIDLDNFVAQLINQKDKNKLAIKKLVPDLEKVKLNKNKENKIIVLNANSLKWQDSNHYLYKLLKSFDNNILGIIINIDSNGGNSGAVIYNLYTQFKKLKQLYNKPVVAYIDKIAFSSGYWLACCADYIIASPLAEIGYVGYRWGRVDYTQKDILEAIKYHAISTNKFGNVFNEHTILTKDEEKQIQEMINSQHAGFIEHIKESRPKLSNNEELWKDAQYYTAYQALDLGIIDAIGCPIDAIKYIEKNKDLKDIEFTFYNLTKLKEESK